VGKDRQADHSPSMELTVCISNVHAILENMGYDSVFPVSAMSTEAYTNSIESRYCWNICSDNTVRVMLFSGGLSWAMRCGFATLNQKENQQACNEDISLYFE